MRLTTKRLILRDITQKDAKDLAKALNNIEISKWMSLIPYPYTTKDARWFIGKCVSNAKKKPVTVYNFFIQLKGNRKVIGCVGMSNVDRFQGTATIGYWLSQEYWRKGIIQEATTRVIDYAFKTLKLRRIDISAFVENKPSNALIRKLGFSYEGMRKKRCRSKSDGSIYDENIYGLLKEDWKH